MSTFRYIASRKLASDHTLLEEYLFDWAVERLTEKSTPDGSEHESMDKSAVEAWLIEFDDSFSITTAPVKRTSTTATYIREMMASCAAGETLAVDLYGDGEEFFRIPMKGRKINHLKSGFISFSFTLKVI